MEFIESIVDAFNAFITTYVVPEEFLVGALLLTGLFLTLRLGLVQIRRLKHGLEVTSGKYDDPNEPGDVTHFQALTTALSATVGVGNIAGVATAIHWGGPGALFWMWLTAFFGMAVKFSEVTLSLKFRKVETEKATALTGTVSGGPMYYIERGMGTRWKPLAVFFACGLMLTSFITGNAVQANTVSDILNSNFGIAKAVVGLITAALVSLIIFGGIKRIGRVTSILAPTMALIYVLGAVIILGMNAGEIFPAFGLIISEAFNPTSGVAGTGAGAFMLTLIWGVKRGLFSNEAGQGSAPIAHAAAQTDEPVSEGVVALLEPFIDTLLICTITGLVIITTGVWNEKHPTELILSSGDVSFVELDERGIYLVSDRGLDEVRVADGRPQYEPGLGMALAWHEASVDVFYVDEAQAQPFNGVIDVAGGMAVGSDGVEYDRLYGDAVETGAPLTSLAFNRGLGSIGDYIVMLCVALFAVSTAISWSYYGDRCASYVFGKAAIVPFKIVYVIAHFIGATISLSAVWALGDVALSIVTLPNLLALFWLSKVVSKETQSYFERKPWLDQPKH